MDELLFGQHPDEHLVAVYARDEGTMRLLYREGTRIRTQEERFYPFFFLADPSLIDGFRTKYWIKRLAGTLPLNHLCAFEEWNVMWEAVTHILERYNAQPAPRVMSYADLPSLYLLPDPAVQFLMQTGRTLFKGLAPEALVRMQIDIETFTEPPRRFSDPRKPTDRIILIGMSDSTGWEHVIDGRTLSEKQMLQELVRLVQTRDPDVIEGHNILAFDLPYLQARCQFHTVDFALGRDRSPPRLLESRAGGGERTADVYGAEIAGRHVVDTLLLVQGYDAIKRNMESYGLKYAARYFGLAAPDRTYVEGDQISAIWLSDPERLVAYALDDVRETSRLSAHLGGTAFYLTQMVPAPLGVVARSGAAMKIEHLLVREYLRQKHSLPRPQAGSQTTGGYTDIFITGILGPIIHADVESLYPSIMLSRGIEPRTDELHVFGRLLSTLTKDRLEAKRAMQQTTDPVERSLRDARQSSLKILINSFYGYLGYTRGIFNDFAQADAVTTSGQQLLRQLIRAIQDRGGSVIEVDTDGVFFVPPSGIDSEGDERQFVADIAGALPSGMLLALDGRYRKMLSYKKKNYALLDYENRIRVRGSSLVSRSIERFGRSYVRQCIEFLLQGDVMGLHRLYLDVRTAILDRQLSITDFARTETLRESPEEYLQQVAAGSRNRSASYEAPLKSGRPVRPGDRITYYITGTDPNIKTSESCKLAEEWDPHFPDENTAYYLRRLDEFSEKFRIFFRPQDFQKVFGPEDLFPFSPEGIMIITSPAGGQEVRPPEEQGGTGIWLDEEEQPPLA
jgi:DNA polymerase elongation subunit (family B)